MIFTKKTIATFTSFLAVFSLVLTSPVLAASVVVSQSNPQNWGFLENGTAAVGEFVTGPAIPPLGSGSVRFFTGPSGNGTNSVEVRNNAFAGVPLSSLTELSYSTYITLWDGSALAPVLTLEVNNSQDPGGSIDILQFIPELNGFPTTNTWQSWNALSGVWLSSVTGFHNLSSYLSLFPHSTITNLSSLGGVGFIVGPGIQASSVLDQNVDAFTIGVNGVNTTYDFENVPVVSNSPTNMDECKKAGWQNFTNPVFKNQGSCVSFVEANANAGK